MHKCILCSNSSIKSSAVSFHSFPRNLVRRNQWVEHLKVGKCFDWQRVCSDHFSDDDFKPVKPGAKRLLLSNAIPKLPTNEIHENKETSESSDLVNNTTNRFGSPKSTRKMKKLLENKTNKTMKKGREGLRLHRIFHCTVKSCKNSYPHANVSFFSYPNSSLRDVWVENCGTREIVDAARSKYKKYLKVCGKHFETSMFINPIKKKQLKEYAIPTLHIDKASNISQSATFENSDKECTSIEESCSTDEELYKTMTVKANMNTRIKICEICCVPGCISNFVVDTTMPQVIFLFRPPMEDINKWSSALCMPLTESSLVCELHFKPQDFPVTKLLAPGVVPSVIQPFVDGL